MIMFVPGQPAGLGVVHSRLESRRFRPPGSGLAAVLVATVSGKGKVEEHRPKLRYTTRYREIWTGGTAQTILVAEPLSRPPEKG